MISGRPWRGVISTLLLSCTVSAADLPHVKVGLWSITSSANGRDSLQSVLVCMDTSVVRELMKEVARNLPPGKCNSVIDKVGSKYVEKTDCSAHRGQLHIKSVASFSGTGKLHIDSERTGLTTKTTVIDGKYIDTCPAAMQVGDVVAPNGAKTNVLHSDSTTTAK